MFTVEIIIYPRALMQGNIPSTNSIDFLSHPHSTFRVYILAGITTEQGVSHIEHQLAPLPNHPTTATLLPYPSINYNPLR